MTLRITLTLAIVMLCLEACKAMSADDIASVYNKPNPGHKILSYGPDAPSKANRQMIIAEYDMWGNPILNRPLFDKRKNFGSPWYDYSLGTSRATLRDKLIKDKDRHDEDILPSNHPEVINRNARFRNRHNNHPGAGYRNDYVNYMDERGKRVKRVRSQLRPYNVPMMNPDLQ